jgi:hypothetical protein
VALTPTIKPNDWTGLNRIIRKLGSLTLGITSSPTFASLTLSGSTASSIIYVDSSKILKSATISLPLVLTTGVLSITGLSTLGTANYLPGANAAGTGWEYKQLAGTSNRVTVTHAANLITLSGPQDIHTGASPTFAGLTVGSLAGVLKAATGVVSGSATFDDVGNGSSTTMRTNLNVDLLDGSHASAFQPAHTNLASLAGLTFVSTSFVKMTSAGTFGLDTNVYLTSFTESDPIAMGYIDQSVKVAASPQFANLIITSGGKIKPSANSTSAINIAQADGTAFVTFNATYKRLGVNCTPNRTVDFYSTEETVPQFYFNGNPGGVYTTRVGINNSINSGFGLYISNSLKWSVASYDDDYYLPGSDDGYPFSIFNDAMGIPALLIDGIFNKITVFNDISPSEDESYNLGASDKAWNIIYSYTFQPLTGYKSVDGSAGISATITYLKNLTTSGTLTFKNGILTAQT